MIDSQQAVLSEMIETQIRAQYLDPIKADPDDNALRTQLLRVYVALAQYDAAISAGLDFLIDHRGDRGATYNHLGIAHYLKGDTQQAASDFQQAQDLAPEDEGIRRNLKQAMWALGRSEEPVAAGVTVAAAEGLKGDSGRVDGDSFYWIE
jgi:Flp pilus assembly protein TadD